MPQAKPIGGSHPFTREMRRDSWRHGVSLRVRSCIWTSCMAFSKDDCLSAGLVWKICPGGHSKKKPSNLLRLGCFFKTTRFPFPPQICTCSATTQHTTTSTSWCAAPVTRSAKPQVFQSHCGKGTPALADVQHPRGALPCGLALGLSGARGPG